MATEPAERRKLHRLSALAPAVVLALVAQISSAEPDPLALALSSELRVIVRQGRQIELQIHASDASSFASIAARLTGSAERAGTIEAYNSPLEVKAGRWIGAPLSALTPELRGLVLRNLFPDDRHEGEDWIHVAGSARLPIYDEGLWQVAEWFTGSGEQFSSLMKVNGVSSPELRRGQQIRIPAAVLHRTFHKRMAGAGGSLEYGVDDRGPFAGYRLKEGEALYSAVVLRFTGRTDSEDVQSVATQLLSRSDIRDATDIPTGFEIKIPLELLEAEFLPEGHPRRLAADEQRAALDRETPRVRSGSGLSDVIVIIDPGHGGRDLGTINNGIWEHDYVYDVACRLKEMLEQGSAARVVMTLEDQETGCRPSTADKLIANQQGSVLTTPPFLARVEGEANIGVNLRWYLSNSVYRAALKQGVSSDRVVFLSLHADARHPGLRGLMVYVAGAGYGAQHSSHAGAEYRKYKEVREEKAPALSSKQRVRSEAISRQYAQDVVNAFKAQGLPVQPYQPIRNRILRGKQDFVPAVLRNNAVPTKVLIEMLNLSNREDAKLLGSSRSRQQMAEAILTSLYAHFNESPTAVTAAADD